MTRTRILVALVVAVAAVAVWPAPAFACSCAQMSRRAGFEMADAVFTGTATDRSAGPALGGGSVTYTFAVDAVAKGSVGETTRVTTPADSAACGSNFDIGSRYVIFSFETQSTDHDWETNLCTHNDQTSKAEPLVFADWSPPGAGGDEPEVSDSGPESSAGPLGVIAVLLSSVFALLFGAPTPR